MKWGLKGVVSDMILTYLCVRGCWLDLDLVGRCAGQQIAQAGGVRLR